MLDLTLVVQDFDDVVEADYYPFNAARNQALRLALTEVCWEGDLGHEWGVMQGHCQPPWLCLNEVTPSIAHDFVLFAVVPPSIPHSLHPRLCCCWTLTSSCQPLSSRSCAPLAPMIASSLTCISTASSSSQPLRPTLTRRTGRCWLNLWWQVRLRVNGTCAEDATVDPPLHGAQGVAHITVSERFAQQKSPVSPPFLLLSQTSIRGQGCCCGRVSVK